MNTDALLIKNTKLLKQRNLLFVASALLVITNLGMSLSLLSKDKQVVILPMNTDKQFTVSKNNVSQEYIELIARDLTQSILNITPDNYEYTKEAILKLAHPSFYGALQQQLDELVEDVKLRQIGMHFSLVEMNINKDVLTSEVSGYLETRIGLKQVSREFKKYYLAFDYTGSQFTLKEFYEVQNEASS